MGSRLGERSDGDDGSASEATGDAGASTDSALGGLPLRRVDEGEQFRLGEARRAVGWWLVGSARAMLALARQHALDRVQFGKPIASFQAVRHRLAETLVAIEGAEATLSLPGVDNPDLTALLAKAAAGRAALTAAKHCQQVLGGIGFTAEHDLHHHVERALVLDGLLGSSRELTRKAGAGLRARGSVPRLAQLLTVADCVGSGRPFADSSNTTRTVNAELNRRLTELRERLSRAANPTPAGR